MRCKAGRGQAGGAGKKGGLGSAIAAEIGAEVERLIGAGVVDDFQAIETEARRVGLQIVGQAIAHRLNADHSDAQGPHLSCACGGEARFAGRRAKTFTTALGDLTLERAWYHCDSCGHGFAPRDRTLGMEGSFLSPAVLRMVGLAASRVSFAGSSDLMRDLAGLAVPPKTVERHAEALGREIAADEASVIEPEPSGASTLYLGLDGTGVPARRSEVEGVAGKQADGSAKTREAKLAVVWSADTIKDGSAVRDAGSATYNAAIESIATHDIDKEPAPFAQRILREVERRGFNGASRQVVIGDGAAWIWRFADEYFPAAIEIVDVWHAKGHIFDVAKAVYGPGTDMAGQWARQRCDELDQGRIGDVIDAIRSHAGACEEARKNVEYFSSNRTRMAYPKFRAMGLVVASGVVEGACRNIVAGRLKRGGMRWTVSGANAIIALRCAIESNRFDDFWERRAAA